MIIQVEKITDEGYRDVWNSFVEQHLYSTPYHLWEFGEVLTSTYGYEKHYLIAKSDSTVLGIFPLILIKSRIFGNKLLSLPFCEHGGPLINLSFNNPEVIIFGLFSKVLTLNLKNLDYIEVRNPHLLGRLQEKVGGFGFCSSNRYVTFRINLTNDIEDLWRSLDKKTRNSIRKAIKNGINIYEVDTEDELEKYFSLYLKTQKRHGSPPHSFKLFKNLVKLMKKNVKILLAERCARPIAGIIVFHNRRGIFWWNGVSDPKFRSLNGTDLLLWEVIQWGNENGYTYLDLGRTRRGSGVYRFKKGWGGTEITLKDYTYSINGIVKGTPDPLEDKYRLLTKAWSLLPIFVAKSIGPRIIRQIGL